MLVLCWHGTYHHSNKASCWQCWIQPHSLPARRERMWGWKLRPSRMKQLWSGARGKLSVKHRPLSTRQHLFAHVYLTFPYSDVNDPLPVRKKNYIQYFLAWFWKQKVTDLFVVGCMLTADGGVQLHHRSGTPTSVGSVLSESREQSPAQTQPTYRQLQCNFNLTTIPAGTADKKPLSECWQPSHSALPDANCQLETNSVSSFSPRGLKRVTERTFPPSLPLATLGSASCPTGAGPGAGQVPWLVPFLTLLSAPRGAKHMETLWHLWSIRAWNMPGRAEMSWLLVPDSLRVRGDK